MGLRRWQILRDVVTRRRTMVEVICLYRLIVIDAAFPFRQSIR